MLCQDIAIYTLQAPQLSRREGNYLVEVHADATLPILAEVCSRCQKNAFFSPARRGSNADRTVLQDRVVALNHFAGILWGIWSLSRVVGVGSKTSSQILFDKLQSPISTNVEARTMWSWRGGKWAIFTAAPVTSAQRVRDDSASAKRECPSRQRVACILDRFIVAVHFGRPYTFATLRPTPSALVC